MAVPKQQAATIQQQNVNSTMNILQSIQGIDIYLLDQLLKGRLELGGKVFDAGCGYGRNIRMLLSQGYEVAGIDGNPEALAYLKAEFPEAANNFQTALIEEYSSKTKYDFVICNAVLHFAQGHQHFDAMFKTLANLLAKDGILFIRMTSNIGLEDRVGPGESGVHELPDGSTRYLLTRPKVDSLVETFGLHLIEPVKTVFVDGLRSMTTLVMQN